MIIAHFLDTTLTFPDNRSNCPSVEYTHDLVDEKALTTTTTTNFASTFLLLLRTPHGNSHTATFNLSHRYSVPVVLPAKFLLRAETRKLCDTRAASPRCTTAWLSQLAETPDVRDLHQQLVSRVTLLGRTFPGGYFACPPPVVRFLRLPSSLFCHAVCLARPFPTFTYLVVAQYATLPPRPPHSLTLSCTCPCESCSSLDLNSSLSRVAHSHWLSSHLAVVIFSQIFILYFILYFVLLRWC